jgi:hypothetical protein
MPAQTDVTCHPSASETHNRATSPRSPETGLLATHPALAELSCSQAADLR